MMNEDSLPDDGLVMIWFTFENAEQSGFYSTMTCAVKYNAENGYASPNEVTINEYYGPQRISDWNGEIYGWDKPEKVSTPLWVPLYDGSYGIEDEAVKWEETYK